MNKRITRILDAVFIAAGVLVVLATVALFVLYAVAFAKILLT